MTTETLISEQTQPMSKAGLHTPGPWIVWQSKRDNSLNVAAVKDRAFVCEVGKIAEAASDADTIRADAHLIAAAPELIEALWDLRALIRNYPSYFKAEEANMAELLDKADSAIKKTMVE